PIRRPPSIRRSGSPRRSVASAAPCAARPRRAGRRRPAARRVRRAPARAAATPHSRSRGCRRRPRPSPPAAAPPPCASRCSRHRPSPAPLPSIASIPRPPEFRLASRPLPDAGTRLPALPSVARGHCGRPYNRRTMLIPVVLSGGAGTRLWPVSREAFPKPFMKLGGASSLLQRTLERALPLADGARAAIVTNREYFFKTREEVGELPAARGIRVTQLLEPIGRNTAPAVALAALWAQSVEPDAVLLVLPADHLIPDAEAFRKVARQAAELAAGGSIVLFGIRPSAPETGFGYIEMGDALPGEARAVRRFVEKPDAARAVQFLADGGFVWNSGMFCFGARTILEAMQRHAPELLAAAREAWEASRADATDEKLTISEPPFRRCPEISIDYAVMEKADGVVVLPASFHWSDIGSWKAVS